MKIQKNPNWYLNEEEPIKKAYIPRFPYKYYSQKNLLIRYCDDFVITGNSRELIDERVKPIVIESLKERGLELSEEKTQISDIDKGMCPICRITLKDNEEWHIHHTIPRHEGGNDYIDNLRLLHAICHRQLHSKTSIRNSLLGASLCLIKA